MNTTIFSIFDEPSHVRSALAGLKDLDVRPDDITISSRDPETHVLINAPEVDQASPAVGVGIGAATGGAATALIASAIAPVSAPLFLLFAVGGGMLGALYGSVAGAIVGTGYELQHKQELENALADGKILVAVKTDLTNREALRAALSRSGGVEQSEMAT
jgi:hypothetical protein